MSTGGEATVAAATLPSKSFLLSKGFWAGLIGVLVALWQALSANFPQLQLPPIDGPIFSTILTILSGLGLFSRVTAKTVLTR